MPPRQLPAIEFAYCETHPEGIWSTSVFLQLIANYLGISMRTGETPFQRGDPMAVKPASLPDMP